MVCKYLKAVFMHFFYGLGYFHLNCRFKRVYSIL